MELRGSCGHQQGLKPGSGNGAKSSPSYTFIRLSASVKMFVVDVEFGLGVGATGEYWCSIYCDEM